MAGDGCRVWGKPPQPTGTGLPGRPGGHDEATAFRHGSTGEGEREGVRES